MAKAYIKRKLPWAPPPTRACNYTLELEERAARISSVADMKTPHQRAQNVSELGNEVKVNNARRSTQLCKEMWENGRSVSEIVQLTGFNQKTVLKKIGVSTAEAFKSQIYELWEAGTDRREISMQIGCSITVVNKVLEQYENGTERKGIFR